jgi:nitroreductase
MQFRTLIEKRKSIRKFLLTKEANWRFILRAIDCARFIPLAGNHYNLKFIVVQEKELISNISQACQQTFINDANYVVVCVSDDSALEKLYGERARRYSAQQAGAAIQNFLLAITDLGLATTWIGYFYEDMIKSLLQIPENLNVEAIFPIGIEAKNNTQRTKSKIGLDNIVYFDKWGNRYMYPESIIPSESI